MKRQFVEVIKRKIPLDHVGGASLRYDRMKFMRCFNTVHTYMYIPTAPVLKHEHLGIR